MVNSATSMTSNNNDTPRWFFWRPSRTFNVLQGVLIFLLCILLIYAYAFYRIPYSVRNVGREIFVSHIPNFAREFWVHQEPLLDYIPDSKWTEYKRLNMTEKLNLLVREKASMKDPRLIDLIRKHILPPSDKPYALKDPDATDYSCGQSSYINSLIMNSKEKGFFVEAGAWLGEYASTSLFFEKSRGWNGILIEPDPTNFETLRKLNRKAFHLNACLSTHSFPVLLKLNSASDMSRTIENKEDEKWVIDHHFDIRPYYEVPCFPLYSIMLAINQTSIDYFGLDVEGNELPILQTIPFDVLDITSMTTECLEMNTQGRTNAAAVRTFLENKGYMCHGTIGANSGHGCFAEDFIFLKKGLVSEQYKCTHVLDPFISFIANRTVQNHL
ncbi:hypothetical protein CHS0354_031732 [Potamilus streckersoni]|uniref:Methyltransferase FkbM domain-containing protein n=1 Tax=Potamilus streckersoni TaxID=2493646 RepID=A0AAE0TC83_9BIVA|nr:hypothetical protein CHS0354_031732 [Potamilus streckersoni]